MNWTDNTLMFITVITGMPFIVIALLTMKFPPKKINHLYGYRTKSSMKSQERWDFAQRYSSKQLLLCGIFLVTTGLLSTFMTIEQSMGIYIAIPLIVSSVVLLFYNTESQLKKRYR